jgi:ABC-type transport system involved in multi-copper enzyme maturation permease subunit
MVNYFEITLKSILRDRVFHGIIFSALIFLLIPSVASLSMRQMTELSVNLSLSLLSFILLLLAVFLGGTHLWRDVERRYTYSALTLPVSRTSCLISKYLGIAFFIITVSCVLGLVAAGVVQFCSGVYAPDRPIVWENFAAAVVFDALKYTLVVAIAFLFSSVATSFFLPIFGTICIFFVGSASQQAYDYITAPATTDISPAIKNAATFVYYLLPNFSAFDYKVNAAYGVPISLSGLFLTLGYFFAYVLIVLTLAAILFEKREMN